MEQCPICDTEFTKGEVDYCATCGWDLTPYPISFELPESFVQKERDKIYWAKNLWQKMESQSGQYKSDLSQQQSQFSDAQLKIENLE
ncbi:MAG: GUN4 domain-containing protein, partial [Trichodesmium sp. St18_bin1]|nr:GUN4 domain-containing protein [Trichodesmium sp. St18_bin1]